MTKKIISLLMSFLLILNVAAVFADTTEEYTYINYKKYDMMKGLLTALEIIDENNMPGSRHDLTRGEFAGYVEKMTNSTVSAANKNIFWDVSEDYQYKGAITLLADLGCVSGNPDGSFQPNEPVTEGAAIKILVCLLGYNDYVQVTGGYYMGYYNTAKKIGLISNDDISGATSKLTQEKFIELMYRALTVSVADVTSIIVNPNGELTGIIDNSERKTLLERYYNMYFVEGVVEANSYANISYNGSFNDGTISIDDVKYYSDKEYDKYLGYNVRCFYELNEEATEKYVIYMHPETDTEVYELLPDAGTRISGDTVYFYSGNHQIKKKIDKEALCVLYNGQHINYVSDLNDNLFDIDTGKIILVDNDEDSEIEFIRVMEYKDMVVFSKNEDDMKIYDASGVATISIDEEGYCIITDTLGNSLTFNDIDKNTVLSFAQSKNGKVIDIIASYDYIEGMIEQKETEEDYYILTIDSKEYKALKGAFNSSDLVLSTNYTFYMNYVGNIVYVEEGTSNSLTLGYLAMIGKTGAFDEYSAKIMDKKSNLNTYKFASKVKIDGTLLNGSKIADYFTTNFPVPEGETYIKEIIRYSLNDSNELNEIDTSVYNAEKETENTLRARYSGDYLRWQAGNSTIKRFHVRDADASSAGFAQAVMFMYGCTSDVFAVAEPEKTTDTDGNVIEDINIDEVYVSSTVPVEKGQQGVSAKLYSINDNTPIFNAVIIKNGTAVTGVGDTLYIVTGKGYSLDSEGSDRQYVKLRNGDVETKMFISEKYTSDSSLGSSTTGVATALEDIDVGDIVRYCPDTRGDVQYFLTVFDYPTKTFTARSTYITSDPKVTGGIVYDINDIFVRIMATYMDTDGVEHNITPANVNEAIDATLAKLEDNYLNGSTKLISKMPNRADAVDALGELVYFSSVGSYEVVRNKVIFSSLSVSDIPDFVHSGSDCATIIITTSLGNLPTKSAIVIK